MVDLTQVVAAVEVSYRILASKVLALLCMIMTFALFAWSMWQASWLHFAVAGTFGLTIFLPVLWITRTANGDKNGRQAV